MIVVGFVPWVVCIFVRVLSLVGFSSRVVCISVQDAVFGASAMRVAKKEESELWVVCIFVRLAPPSGFARLLAFHRALFASPFSSLRSVALAWIWLSDSACPACSHVCAEARPRFVHRRRGRNQPTLPTLHPVHPLQGEQRSCKDLSVFKFVSQIMAKR